MSRGNQKKTSFLKGFFGLEPQKKRRIFSLLAILIFLLCAFFFYKTQKVLPLWVDQITNATIVEHLQNPHLYEHDPLWGYNKLFLPLNLGVLSFYLLSCLGPIEVGIPIALTLVMLLYLILSYIVFYKFSQSPALALSLSLLSCFFVEVPAATYWGIGYSPTFLSRTIYLPFVPLIFYGFLAIIKDPTEKKCVLFYFLLGISSLFHQISSLYLFISFLLCSFLLYPRSLKIHIFSVISWLLALSPLIVYGIYHYTFSGHLTYPSALLQGWIESVFPWAFFPLVGQSAYHYIASNPHHIIILLLVPFIFWKNRNVKYLTTTVITIMISSLVVYGVQFLILEFFKIPFKFIEVLRGLRFLPFIAFLLVAVIWQDLVVYFRRAPLLQPIITIMLLAFSIFIFSFKYYTESLRFSGFTCSDHVFEEIQQLPPSALIATDLGVRQQLRSTSFTAVDTIRHLRFCGKHAVYVMLIDGSMAYYNGTDQFIRWINRIQCSFDFFITLDNERLNKLKRDGVTHLCVKGELPSSNLWKKVYCSPQYCLYQLADD